MKIDIQTLVLSLVMGFSLLWLQLLVARHVMLRQSGLRVWSYGCWALLAGLVALASRAWGPLWVSVLLGNGLVALGELLYAEGLRRHLRGRGLSRIEWAFGGAVMAVFALGLDLSTAQRTTLFCGLLALLLLPGLWPLYAMGRRLRGTLLPVALMLTVAFVSMAARSIWSVLDPAGFSELLDVHPGLGQALTFGLSFASLLAAGFCFVLACFERVAVRLEELALTDGLTGCLNRNAIDSLLAHNIERAKREDTALVFALMDLDHFKALNDSRGHQAGDAALRSFAKTVRERLRSSDVFGRVGGDEFALILPHTDERGALLLLEQVRAAVALGQSLTVTIGAAQLRESGTADALYARADEALYGAKQRGRNRVELSWPTTLSQATVSSG
ncbi:diguanylate cyclase [Pelomonas sp. KK5]|uniref:GGDEF domain-containing protein n=1 Tax=Pelomonas sp. KK5 TaxID=1855730 RepID=UPI00097C7F26|nr:GGDEF domain-containing protein [Pelomonas sp. KK5]